MMINWKFVTYDNGTQQGAEKAPEKESSLH